VLPPVVTRVTEASGQDIGMLATMHEQALRAGHDLRDYDPNSRYVTIRGTGIDHNSSYIKVQFIQNGRRYTLKPADFSLSLGDRWVVRLPDGIRAGQAQVIVQNLGAGLISDPANALVEITRDPN